MPASPPVSVFNLTKGSDHPHPQAHPPALPAHSSFLATVSYSYSFRPLGLCMCHTLCLGHPFFSRTCRRLPILWASAHIFLPVLGAGGVGSGGQETQAQAAWSLPLLWELTQGNQSHKYVYNCHEGGRIAQDAVMSGRESGREGAWWR